MTKITKLHVYDLDGTLINTPTPEYGRAKWEEAYGKPFPHTGWWSKMESLDTEIFEMNLLPEVKAFYDESYGQPDTMNIMLTGRRGGRKFNDLTNALMAILKSKGLEFDSHHFNYMGDTAVFKVSEMNSILTQHPDIEEVTMYDDRDLHIPIFQTWGDDLVSSGKLTKFKIHHIKGDHHG
jgi:hypothetical protein